MSMQHSVSESGVQILARTFFRSARQRRLTSTQIVSFVNELLELTIAELTDGDAGPAQGPRSRSTGFQKTALLKGDLHHDAGV